MLEMLEEEEGETNCRADGDGGETLSLQRRNKLRISALNSFVFVDLSFLS